MVLLFSWWVTPKNLKNTDPDPYDSDSTNVLCLADERFSCWDNNTSSTGFEIGIRVCAMFGGVQGSWENEVPLMPESYLNLLDGKGFKFNKNTYK